MLPRKLAAACPPCGGRGAPLQQQQQQQQHARGMGGRRRSPAGWWTTGGGGEKGRGATAAAATVAVAAWRRPPLVPLLLLLPPPCCLPCLTRSRGVVSGRARACRVSACVQLLLAIESVKGESQKGSAPRSIRSKAPVRSIDRSIGRPNRLYTHTQMPACLVSSWGSFIINDVVVVVVIAASTARLLARLLLVLRDPAAASRFTTHTHKQTNNFHIGARVCERLT
jgi:hypothetical protein